MRFVPKRMVRYEENAICLNGRKVGWRNSWLTGVVAVIETEEVGSGESKKSRRGGWERREGLWGKPIGGGKG